MNANDEEQIVSAHDERALYELFLGGELAYARSLRGQLPFGLPHALTDSLHALAHSFVGERVFGAQVHGTLRVWDQEHVNASGASEPGEWQVQFDVRIPTDRAALALDPTRLLGELYLREFEKREGQAAPTLSQHLTQFGSSDSRKAYFQTLGQMKGAPARAAFQQRLERGEFLGKPRKVIVEDLHVSRSTLDEWLKPIATEWFEKDGLSPEEIAEKFPGTKVDTVRKWLKSPKS